MTELCTSCCGTGTWTGPAPGDPNFDVALFATPAFGGIQLGWSYPSVNPAAVAHTQVYRGNTADASGSSQIAIAAGSTFFDQLSVTTPTTYYYWIRIVSVNGTVGDLVGPASAVAKPRSQAIGEDLSSGGGSIDDSYLSQELRSEIGRITLTYDELRQEILNRIGANNAFAAALNATNGQLTNALTLIAQEEQQRVDGQAALVSRMDMLAAINNDNAAAIIHEAELRLAADSAAASDISALYTATGNTAAAVVNETNARTAADSSLASQINTVQSTLGNQIASVQTNAQTQIDATNNKVNALWTVKVQAGSNPPRIAGIGLTNDGTTADFGIIADRFWFDTPDGVGRVKPFVIENNTVYMENAVIRNLQAENFGSNAVTQSVTASGYTDGSSNQRIGNTASLNIPANASSVLLVATWDIITTGSFWDNPAGNHVETPVSLEVDGSALHTVSSTQKTITFIYTNPPVGSHGFRIVGNRYSISDLKIFATVFKR